jgi:hypothetical protein
LLGLDAASRAIADDNVRLSGEVAFHVSESERRRKADTERQRRDAERRAELQLMEGRMREMAAAAARGRQERENLAKRVQSLERCVFRRHCVFVCLFFVCFRFLKKKKKKQKI